MPREPDPVQRGNAQSFYFNPFFVAEADMARHTMSPVCLESGLGYSRALACCQLPIFRTGLKKSFLAIDNRPEFVYIL